MFIMNNYSVLLMVCMFGKLLLEVIIGLMKFMKIFLVGFFVGVGFFSSCLFVFMMCYFLLNFIVFYLFLIIKFSMDIFCRV